MLMSLCPCLIPQAPTLMRAVTPMPMVIMELAQRRSHLAAVAAVRCFGAQSPRQAGSSSIPRPQAGLALEMQQALIHSDHCSLRYSEHSPLGLDPPTLLVPLLEEMEMQQAAVPAPICSGGY